MASTTAAQTWEAKVFSSIGTSFLVGFKKQYFYEGILKSHIDPGHNYHRAHFLDALADLLPAGVAHLGKRLVSFTYKNTPTGQVGLHFIDGTSATCDVLLGCDGIRSVVRRCMFEGLARDGRPQLTQYIEPVWTGEILYRCLIPSEELPLKNGGKHPVLQRPIIVSTCSDDNRKQDYTADMWFSSIVEIIKCVLSPQDNP